MYILTVEDNFASAHQLREYKGKCENLHGHNWKVELRLKGQTLDSTGMLIDFGDVKVILKEILAYLDHKNLNEVPPFDKINPTSENVAEYIYEKASEKVRETGRDLAVYSVTVWESATSRCEYSPD